MKRDEIYKKVSLKHAKGVTIKSSLCFYNPKEVYMALTSNKEVRRWFKFISNHYVPPKAKILLFYPCSAEKPYHKSRSYQRLFSTLSKLGEKRKEVHVVTISEPFCLVPEEFYGKKTDWHDWENSWYDCPGLFEWWCRKYGQPYDEVYVEKCIDILSNYVSIFLRRTKDNYNVRIAFIRTYSSSLKLTHNHTHYAIIRRASEKAGVSVEFHPPKEIIKEILNKRGKMAWDLYGIAHPYAQEYLLYLLRNKLGRCP